MIALDVVSTVFAAPAIITLVCMVGTAYVLGKAFEWVADLN